MIQPILLLITLPFYGFFTMYGFLTPPSKILPENSSHI